MRPVAASLLVPATALLAVAALAEPSIFEREWAVTRTPSVRLHHEVAHPPSRAGLTALEAEVQRLADEFRLGAEGRHSLRRHPIDYLYVRNPSSMAELGVDDIDGLAQTAERRIVATRLPHGHEIAHVLAQIAIGPLPAANQPWLQEGLASYLAGHLGQAAPAVLGYGEHVLEREPGLVASLLTVEGFVNSPLAAEARYAACARFVQYLDTRAPGREGVLELYRLLAGFEEEVAERPASVVELQLEGVYEVPFGQLLDSFDAWRREQPPAGILPGVPPGREADLVLADSDHDLKWWSEPDGWTLVARAREGEVDLVLSWQEEVPPAGRVSGPAADRGIELRLDAGGGSLVDRGGRRVLLRWFARADARAGADVAWHLPAAALDGIAVPAADAVELRSQPRFRVD